MEVFMCSSDEHDWCCVQVKNPERQMLGSVHINIEYECSVCGVRGIVDTFQYPRVS